MTCAFQRRPANSWIVSAAAVTSYASVSTPRAVGAMLTDVLDDVRVERESMDGACFEFVPHPPDNKRILRRRRLDKILVQQLTYQPMKMSGVVSCVKSEQNTS